jgi:multiple sugar transport system permease protein
MENLLHPPKMRANFFSDLRKMGPSARREMRNGLLFLSPWLLGFLVFTLLPIIVTFFLSFVNVKLTEPIWPPHWVGFDNYVRMFKDSAVWNARPNSTPGSMWITLRFGLIALPVGILLPLGIALLMNNPHLKAQNLFPKYLLGDS